LRYGVELAYDRYLCSASVILEPKSQDKEDKNYDERRIAEDFNSACLKLKSQHHFRLKGLFPVPFFLAWTALPPRQYTMLSTALRGSLRRSTVLTHSLFASASKPRFLCSEHNPAITKLKSIFEQYRSDNFSQTTPPRFRKEFINAADADGDGVLTKDEVSEMLKKIGAEEAMTENEIEVVFGELGGSDGEGILREKFEELL